MPTPEARIFARNALADDPGELDEDWLADQLDRFAAQRGAELWQPIETAPKDGEPALLCGMGADDRPMIVKVHWGCGQHAFSSKHQCSRRPLPDCEFRWMGEMGQRYGVEFTHWMPLPSPPGAPPQTGGGSPHAPTVDEIVPGNDGSGFSAQDHLAPQTGGGDAPDEIAIDYSAKSRLANSVTEGA